MNVLAIPILSAKEPMGNPNNATDSAGSVMIMEVRNFPAPNSSSMPLRDGATAAAPMRISMDARRRAPLDRPLGLNPPSPAML